MDTNALIVLFALFLGVMGVIAMLEYRRRQDLAQFVQLTQTLSDGLELLQAIHSANAIQFSRVAEALVQVRGAVESGTKSSSDAAEITTVRLESGLVQQQKALSDAVRFSSKEIAERLEWFAGKLSSSTDTNSKQLLTEMQRTTKAIQDLQASLEASVKF